MSVCPPPATDHSLSKATREGVYISPKDRFTVCVWPTNFEVQDTGIPFLAPGFAGNVWAPNDPALDYVIIRQYMCVEVVATCVDHDIRAPASEAAIASSCPV